MKLTARYGLQPSEINRLPIDRLEAYLDGGDGDSMTFANEQALMRYLATQQQA